MIDINPSNEIDWSNIKTLEDVTTLGDHRLYDLMPDDDAFSLYINSNLTEYEYNDALFWARFMNGVILITGKPGSGKSTLLHIMAWKFKRYFGKLAICKPPPRPIFGLAIPNSTEFLVEQLDRIADLMGDQTELLEQQNSRRWFASANREIFLKHCVMMEDEFSNKVPMATPNLSICQIYLKLATVWRHLDLAIIGVTTKKEDITHFIYPEVTAEIKVDALPTRPGVSRAILYPLSYNSMSGHFAVREQPIPIYTDILAEQTIDRHPDLQGYRWVDLFNSKNPQTVRVPNALRKEIKKQSINKNGGGL